MLPLCSRLRGVAGFKFDASVLVSEMSSFHSVVTVSWAIFSLFHNACSAQP
jgi:hypothetical protein